MTREQTPEQPQQQRVKSADRTIDIFELLASEVDGMLMHEIAERLGIARSSTHGLVRTLQARGYLLEDGLRRIHLGAGLIQLGLNARDRLELCVAARRPLERLVQRSGHTALLVMLDHGDLVYVDKFFSSVPEVRTDPRASTKAALHCSSLGKALLASVNDDAVNKLIDLAGLHPATEHSINDRGALLSDLAAIRGRGYSLDEQEALLGVYCVGAPIRDHAGQSIAAVSLSTIKDFFDPQTYGPIVAETALEISAAMGWQGDSSTLFNYVEGSELLLFDRDAVP